MNLRQWITKSKTMSCWGDGSMSQAAQAMIQLDGVTRAFGDTLAVDDVSFHVDASTLR